MAKWYEVKKIKEFRNDQYILWLILAYAAYMLVYVPFISPMITGTPAVVV
tara:strand:+ start:366 stop:515 length:150 start_codon:yes stop_codon:yes gene_type:complete